MATIEPKTVTLKNGLEVCIRTPVADDTANLLEYLKAIFADDRFFMTTAEEAEARQTPEKEQEFLQSNYDNDSNLIMVTEADGKFVSMSHVSCGSKNRVRHVASLGISILPEYRGNGLGTLIMQTMIEWATRHPVIEKLALGVWDFNERAIALYKNLGFTEEGRKIQEVKFGPSDYADEILMYKDVKTGASDGSD